MAEWVLKYADARGEIHHQVAQASSEKEIRERYTQQGFLIYSVQPRRAISAFSTLSTKPRRKLNLEKFLIFNQQFVTLVRAGLPILKSLDLLADRLTDPNSALMSRPCATTSATALCSPTLSATKASFRRSTSLR